MKNKLPILFVAICCIFGAARLASAQTADEIIAKNINAIGGRELIGKIQSIHMETDTQVMGNPNHATVTILNGKGYREESELNDMKFIQCWTDTGGWTINPMGIDAPEVMTKEQYSGGKGQIYIGGQLFDYAARGSKVELLGKEGGAYKIKLTTSDNQVATYYLDANTYFLTRITRSAMMQGLSVELTTSYSDYKRTDFGFTLAYTTEIDFGGNFTISNTIRKVEINKPVDPKIFEMPK